MGRANPALRIAVWCGWLEHPAIRALAAQGHDIINTNQAWVERAPDLILHPAAHGWSDAMFVKRTGEDGVERNEYPYLDVAMQAARKRRKERKA